MTGWTYATTHGQRDISDDRLSALIEQISLKRLGLTDVEAGIIGKSYQCLIRKFAEGSGQGAGKLRSTLSYSSLLGSGRNYFHIRGTEGLMMVEDDRLIVAREDGGTRTVELLAEDMHEQMWRTLARCMAENREPEYTKECALRDLSILFGVERAIKTGNRVLLGQG